MFRSLPFQTLPATTPSSPGEWENACNEMQRMLIVRSLRQDRVAFCVTSFIVSNLGSRFIEPPVLNMKLVSGLVSLPTSSRVLPLHTRQPHAFPHSLSPTLLHGLLLRPHPVLPAGDGRFNPTHATGVHPVPWRGPHQCPVAAGRAHRHGAAFPLPVPGPGPGPHCCSAPPGWHVSGSVAFLFFCPHPWPWSYLPEPPASVT